MSRSQRLLDLLQLLRTRNYAVTGRTLARELDVSLRTLYRDIATLQTQGAAIDGEAGVGYLLRPGFLLPPLMFSTEEIEALVLGISWVSSRADAALAKAAKHLRAKVKAVLPAALRRELEATTLIVGPGAAANDEASAFRRAIRGQRKLWIRYRDENGSATERTIRPFALGYFDSVQIVMAWCELRGDFRHFRADRIDSWRETEPYTEPRSELLARWREREGLTPEEDA